VKWELKTRAQPVVLAVTAAAALLLSASDVPAQDPQQLPWRAPAIGNHGAVTAGHPLAATVGLDVLRSGGNAVDAAVSMAGVLAVVRPHMNGIGGDTFMLVYSARDGQVYGLNGSGRAGSRSDAADLRAQGMLRIPPRGINAVTVPGSVSAWATAASRFGTRPLNSLLEPARRLAFSGFPVTPRLRRDLISARAVIERSPELREIFLPGGRFPEVGDIIVQTRLGESLTEVANSNGESFYRGALAGRLATFFESAGGYVTADDLAAHRSDWVEPISTGYRGLQVYAMPPNTQGIALLTMLNLVEQFDVEQLGQNSPDYLHMLIEAKKLAFADRDEHVADPASYQAPVDSLLSDSYARERSARVNFERAAPEVAPGQLRRLDDDTVVCTAADIHGNMVVLIQSLFNSFGSGVVAGDTGIILQNRGALFTIEEGHPNEMVPGRRPYHTLCPSMIMRDGVPVLGLATPGGDGQVQTLVQVINRWHVFGLDIQSAIEAPRFRSYDGLDVSLEQSVGLGAIDGLERKGHQLRFFPTGRSPDFGGAQGIVVLRSSSGEMVYMAGADPRREAAALAW
jgi:gamma-glutamyltranspeptidase/glutathione hydrolase